MCYDHSSLFHSSVQNFLASRARDRNRRPAALALLQRLARRPVHQPSRRLRPSRPKRLTSLDGQAGQGAVSSRDPGTPPSGGSLRRQPRPGAVSRPRRHPTQPLLGSMWRKWLKVAAWPLAFLQPPGDIKFLTVRDLITPSRSTRLPSQPPKTAWWGHRISDPVRRGSCRTVTSLSTI